jgi:sulfonate transport system ATP-binding protein
MAPQFQGELTVTVVLPDALVSSARAVDAMGICKDFSGLPVLQGLDLQIRKNEFVALLGRSGCGKSTLLRILSGLDPDYTGDVWVPERRSVMFQEPRLVPWKKVLPNVLLGLRGTGPAPKRGLRQRGVTALDEVGLETKANVWPVTLSGGESQRVALARALVREPQLVLLDEPFGALDALTRVKMHVLLQALCARHRPAVLLVTHDVDEAILLADRVLVLTDGRISFDEHVSLGRPRDRGDREFNRLRSRLLTELGMVDPTFPRSNGQIRNSEPSNTYR